MNNEVIKIRSSDKEGIYAEILPQIRGLVADEPSLIANLANVSAVLKMAFPIVSWAGFYLFDGRELVLGPFQGKPACVRIELGKGVCGTAAAARKPIVVPDVSAFPGHIVCDPDARSEIVLPIVVQGSLKGVLDVDSNHLDAFDKTDQKYLEMVVVELTTTFGGNIPRPVRQN